MRRLAAGGIDIGLHLDFTEAPLLPRSRRRLPHLIAASLLRRLDAAQLRAEIRAQLDAFEQALGQAPAFVDGHQHVHQLPVVRGALLDELLGRYRGRPLWLRSTRPAAGLRTSTTKARIIDLLGSKAMDASARRMGFAQNRGLLGVYDFAGGPDRYRSLLAAWLRSARHADLLMCHAGLPAPEAHEPLASARQAEFEMLASLEFGAMLDDVGVALRPMSLILAGASRAAGSTDRLIA